MDLPDFFDRAKETSPIVSVGDAVLDVCKSVRIAPPNPKYLGVTTEIVTDRRRFAGGVACGGSWMNICGAKPTVASVVGTGSTVTALKDAMRECGLATSALLGIEERKTPTVDWVIDRDTGELLRRELSPDQSDIPDLAVDYLIDRVAQSGAQVIVAADYGRGVFTPRLAALLSEYARENERYLIVDARPRPLEWYREHFPYLSLITPNRDEAEAMVGEKFRSLDAALAGGRKIRDALHCDVVLKLDGQGTIYFEKNKYVSRDESGDSDPEKTPRYILLEQGREFRYDTYCRGKPCAHFGQGDVMVATLAVCAAIKGKRICPVSVEIASRAAGLWSEKVTGAMPTREEFGGVLRVAGIDWGQFWSPVTA